MIIVQTGRQYGTERKKNQCGECVCVCVFNTVPVNSVDAHDEGLHVGVRGTAELAAGLSAERGAVTQREMVQRADGAAVSHHWGS